MSPSADSTPSQPAVTQRGEEKRADHGRRSPNALPRCSSRMNPRKATTTTCWRGPSRAPGSPRTIRRGTGNGTHHHLREQARNPAAEQANLSSKETFALAAHPPDQVKLQYYGKATRANIPARDDPLWWTHWEQLQKEPGAVILSNVSTNKQS